MLEKLQIQNLVLLLAMISCIYKAVRSSLLIPHAKNPGPLGNAPKATMNTAPYFTFELVDTRRMAYPIIAIEPKSAR
jgi:hypothetical protein